MSNALSEIHFLLPVAISFLTIAGDRVSMACKIINTARDFPQLDFTVPNDTNFWVWDDVMEQKYWKRLKRWKQMPLKITHQAKTEKH